MSRPQKKIDFFSPPIKKWYMKKVKWFLYPIRFLFVPCCEKCTNIAHRRERKAGWHNVCLNHLIIRSSISAPIDCPLNGWEFDPKYNSPFQWLWVKLKWKQKGKPIHSLKQKQ